MSLGLRVILLWPSVLALADSLFSNQLSGNVSSKSGSASVPDVYGANTVKTTFVSTVGRATVAASSSNVTAPVATKSPSTATDVGSSTDLARSRSVTKTTANRTAATSMRVRPGFEPDSPHWLDTDGHRIEAHGAGMLQSVHDGRWYWYGESKKDETEESGVNCYSSDSLAGPWRFEGKILRESSIQVDGWKGPFIVERPKVIYNEMTKKYVMWFHLDHRKKPVPAMLMQRGASGHLRARSQEARHSGRAPAAAPRSNLSATALMKSWQRFRVGEYILRRIGIATADNPAGPFQMNKSFQPDHIPSLDMSLFVDDDKTAYFIRSCNNAFTGISKLSDDYMSTTGIISKGPLFEGMAIFRHTNGTLFMITSHLTGWEPNPLMLFRATGPSLADPRWVNVGNPTKSSTSFNSQPTFVVKVTPRHGAPYHVYMADNWMHAGPNGLLSASYVWLPIRFTPHDVRLDYLKEWDMDDPFAAIPEISLLRKHRKRILKMKSVGTGDSSNRSSSSAAAALEPQQLRGTAAKPPAARGGRGASPVPVRRAI